MISIAGEEFGDFFGLVVTMVEMPANLFPVKLTFESVYQSKMLLIESKIKNPASKCGGLFFSPNKQSVSGRLWHYCRFSALGITMSAFPLWWPNSCPIYQGHFFIKEKWQGKYSCICSFYLEKHVPSQKILRDLRFSLIGWNRVTGYM